MGGSWHQVPVITSFCRAAASSSVPADRMCPPKPEGRNVGSGSPFFSWYCNRNRTTAAPLVGSSNNAHGSQKSKPHLITGVTQLSTCQLPCPVVSHPIAYKRGTTRILEHHFTTAAASTIHCDALASHSASALVPARFLAGSQLSTGSPTEPRPGRRHASQDGS